jgi:hypothetical protein
MQGAYKRTLHSVPSSSSSELSRVKGKGEGGAPFGDTTVYTQLELPPLIPPWKGGKPENLVPSPFQGEG